MPLSSLLALRMRRSARDISPAWTTAAADSPYEAMPSARCRGSQAEAWTAIGLPGKIWASSTARAPSTDSTPTARSLG